ncbi:MAG: TrkA family potassium uptake protein [Termitinemataceae bacterium]|nr:MAG: TrkA family potassium uptake protein [Termitinemataceae bacterium]
MKQTVILGLDSFGKEAVKCLLELEVDIMLIDKDKELIDTYKDSGLSAIVLDILTVDTLRSVFPTSPDAVIIDMGKRLEASILATSYCAKLNIPQIVAIAETKAHGEILSLVGATNVVFPNQEAAKRVTRQIMSASFINYITINDTLSIVELTVPTFLIGKKLLDSQLRQKYDINLLFIKNSNGDFKHCPPTYMFKENDIGLFSGTDKALDNFAVLKNKSTTFLSKLFGNHVGHI